MSPSPAFLDTLDLDQLAVRESEQVEWKENVADENDVVRTLSAFANDLANLGGGYVVCGVAEQKDEFGFPKLSRTGLTSERLKKLEGIVLNRCREYVSPSITPIVQELPSAIDGRRILVFIQPATSVAHTCRLGDQPTKHYVRVGRTTVEARNGVLRDLLVRKGTLEPWDRRPCYRATVNDVDLLALRDALQRMRVFSSDVGIEPYLSDDQQISALVPPLFAREPLTGQLRPRNFALLLFGREPQRFIAGAVCIFSIYSGQDRSDIHAERHELTGTLVEQAARLNSWLDVQASTAFDKSDNQSPNALKYPKRALYEAMGNALSHRDYEDVAPTRVTVFSDRIEMLSPGALPLGVDPIAFSAGRAGPRWRNQALAWFFNRLQIAQAEGQGIPTILRTMREEGCPPPLLEPQAASVLCTLPAHPRHALLRDFRDIEQSIALGQMGEARSLVLKILREDPENARAVQLFAEIQMALRDSKPVADFLQAQAFATRRLPPSVLLLLSEALNAGPKDGPHYRAQSSALLKQASMGRLEERETRRLAIAMIRNGEEQQAIDYLNIQFDRRPDWQDNAALLQVRGDAFIGLAKHCRKTLNRPKIAPSMRERVRNQQTAYLKQAEGDLERALSLTNDIGLAEIIGRNLEFMRGLTNRKPVARRR